MGNAWFDYGGAGAAGAGDGIEKAVIVKYNTTGTALWARSVSGANDSRFTGVAVDGAGNVYAAGYQCGNKAFTYGADISAQGNSIAYNSVIVKYSKSGEALWARSVVTSDILSKFQGVGADGIDSQFAGVAADGAGNVYAAGGQYGSEVYDYGGGISVQGSNAIATYPVIVKYNSAGSALWARSLSGENGGAEFNGVAADGTGNVTVVGYQTGVAAYNYGNGVSARGGADSSSNAVIVQYSSAGTALWAQAASGGNSTSEFYGVSADGTGKVYAAGLQVGQGAFDYGGISATGNYGSLNPVVVQYNSAGSALWAQSAISSPHNAGFHGVAADGTGGFTTAGAQQGTGLFDFGNGVTIQCDNGYDHGNAILVWYK
jgi:hypothetical protein